MNARETTSLAGHLLIAMPTLADPNFSRTVTFLCEHDEQGALGVTINRPLEITLGEVLAQLQLPTDDAVVAGAPVFHGGPCHTERGFVIHDATHEYAATLRVTDELAVTTSQDVLKSIASGIAPPRILVALGCAGWAPGQLEQELAENTWLSVPGAARIVFETPFDQRWDAAAGLLGVDIRLLTGDAGHA
ncbi:MAG: YqgE/AlgH family protein [Xanthomonadaceae bacterium]|nr:YqgE/AlgH family protein [Xanthomonadaceae bacterium]